MSTDGVSVDMWSDASRYIHSTFKCFFFFQAEDGIRDGRVTGVQTCALPIWSYSIALEPTTIAEPAVARVAEPAALLYDLYALVGLIHRETLPLVGSGLIAKKALARLNAELRVQIGRASCRERVEVARVAAGT